MASNDIINQGQTDPLDNADIIIVTTPFGLSIAYNLAEELKRLNFKTAITNIVKDCDVLHILLFSFKIEKLPKRYIIYQLEQINKSPFLTDRFYTDLENSLISIDYSQINYLNLKNSHKKYIRYQPMPIANKIIEYTPNYEYDILFFGGINERRKNILDHLFKEKFVVGYTTDTFFESLYTHVKKAKIILNLHYYDNAILETARINEILPFNTLIVSESFNRSNEINNFYKDDVFFIENINDNLSNIHILVNQLRNCLDNFDIYKSRINKTRENTITQLNGYFSHYLKKNLYECGVLQLDTYDKYINFEKIICLTNGDISNFKQEFIKNNSEHINDVYFLTKINNKAKMYYMLFKQFLDTKINTITICEDTCVFPDNFKQTFRTINNYFITNVFDIYISSQKNISKDIDNNKIQNIKLFNNVIFINLIDIKTEDLFKIDMLPFNIFSRNFAQKYINIFDKIENNVEKTMENIINIMLNYNISYVSTNINYFNNINSSALLT
jgi:hypothetical protein